MRLQRLIVFCGSLWPILAYGQQPALKASTDHPAPGEVVVLEVNVHADRKTKLSWSKDGDGDFVTETQNQDKVNFKAGRAGTTVIIVCDVSVPGRQEHPSVKLVVADTPETQPAKPNVTTAKGSAPQPTPPPQRPGDLALTDMEYMVPSGYMGDAMADNNEAATLDTAYNVGCRTGSPSCIKVEYKPSDGKVGWAAFAWQRVIEGSQNWGESPGADFSKGGFKSLRVLAKGVPDESGRFPKAQFKSGGNVAPQFKENRATYAVAGPVVPLTGAFQEICVSLENRDLSNTVSPFTVVVTKAGNPRTIVVLLEDVRFSRESCR